MNKTETRRFLAIMEFFYGFLFGVAIFGATLTFIIMSNFFIAILFSICIFSLFIFLMILVRYCIIRVKIAQQTLEATLDCKLYQEQIFHNTK